MMSLDNDISTGSQKLRPEDLLSRERPATPQDAFLRARSWGNENWFVRTVHDLRVAFYNYGLAIGPVDNKDNQKLTDWLKKNPQADRLLRQQILETWREADLIDTVVSFWREAEKSVENDGSVFLFKPEQCKYINRQGIRVLKVKLDKPEFKPTEVQTAGKFTDVGYQAAIDRYFAGKEIVMDKSTEEKWDEYFEVFTRGLRGEGFVLPRLYSLFRTLSQSESMEVGETMLAYAGRRVMHRNKIGFELRNNNPGTNFQKEFSMWTKKRADKILAFFNGRSGFMDTVENFDAELEVFLGDGGPKNYDGRKWDTVVKRFLWWGGPLGFMLCANSLNPFLLNILKIMAAAEREEVGKYLNYVLNRAFTLPCPIQLHWSDKCFTDSRLAWDICNGLVKQGALSLTTALEENDYCPGREAERKTTEALPANAKKYLPLLPAGGAGKGGPAGGAPGEGAGRPNQKGAAEGAKKSGQTSGRKK